MADLVTVMWKIGLHIMDFPFWCTFYHLWSLSIFSSCVIISWIIKYNHRHYQRSCWLIWPWFEDLAGLSSLSWTYVNWISLLYMLSISLSSFYFSQTDILYNDINFEGCHIVMFVEFLHPMFLTSVYCKMSCLMQHEYHFCL